MLDHLPDTLSAELNLLGVRTTGNNNIATGNNNIATGNNNIATGNEKQKVERDYTFKKPNLDEHGEPDF